MTRRLRPYQTEIHNAIFTGWQQNTLAVAPTGGGKTVIMASVVARMGALPGCAVAHRAELVSQISTTLAGEGIPHRIIGPDTLRRSCSALHMADHSRNWVVPDAPFAVASVATLVNDKSAWRDTVQYWIGDEAHHFQPGNQWGKAVALFKHKDIRGLGLTATPRRADGRGLDSVFQRMVQGPTARQLIDAGYLTDYRIFAPPSDVDYSDVNRASDGDYNLPQLRAAVHKSTQFVGDVVRQYQRIAPGKLAAAFCVDIENATEIAAAFRAAGVNAQVLTGKTDPLLRRELLRQFRARVIQVLVTVDIISEGFDLPALECVIMGRKTESLSLFMQQFGRGLRVMVDPALDRVWDQFTDEQRRGFIAISAKPQAIIIDHVQNVHRHGLPDAPRLWALQGTGGGRGAPSDAVPTRVCVNPVGPCLSVYERFLTACPYCGHKPVPPDRSTPAAVDGDLFELSPAVLAAMRGEVEHVNGAPPAGVPQYIAAAWQARIIALHGLRELMALWFGWQDRLGRPQPEQYKLFFLTFGIDVMGAQALSRPDAVTLAARVSAVLSNHGVVPI